MITFIHEYGHFLRVYNQKGKQFSELINTPDIKDEKLKLFDF